MRRRAWFLMVADTEVTSDALGRMTEQPLGEPTVVAATWDPIVAERALAAIAVDAGKGDSAKSMVRAGIEAMPVAVAAVLDTEADGVDRILAMTDSK
jgi:hypothetical protein